MKAIVIILGFIVYSLAVFWINHVAVLGVLFATECLALLAITRRFNWRRILQISLFLGFIFLCNLAYCDAFAALVVALRLALSLLAAIIVSCILTTRELGRGITLLISPVKLFGANLQELNFSIMIALNILPILFREAKITELSLKARGADWRTLLRRPSIYINAYLENVFTRTAAIEQSLRLKGY